LSTNNPAKFFLNQCRDSYWMWGLTGSVGKVTLNLFGRVSRDSPLDAFVFNVAGGLVTLDLSGAEFVRFEPQTDSIVEEYWTVSLPEGRGVLTFRVLSR
jgi:hypothetical protein